MATIYYHDIGDYLSREQKLKMVHDFRSVKGMEWTEIVPNEKRDWINVRDGFFDGLIAITDKSSSRTFFEKCTTNGLKTGRDAWAYNFSQQSLNNNMHISVDYYNEQREKVLKREIEGIQPNLRRISLDEGIIASCKSNKKISFSESYVIKAVYRPFCKQHVYYHKPWLQRTYQLPRSFPKGYNDNITICIPGVGGTKPFHPLIANCIPDLGFNSGSQCLPLYYYEENTHKQKTLFDDTSDDDYIRHDGITDWILKEVRNRYNGAKNITKEMIFYYVYGLLHSKDYRERFAADLKKSLPRIPIVERIEDFMAFYKAGKQLAELHLNYEEVPPHPEVVVHITAKRADQDDYDYFRVDPKMKFRSKDDKSVIFYNANIRLENIPLKAYDYIVNGKSAIEWIVERYCVSIDKKSLIKNDANDWAREHGKPRYILDLLLSVINVSTQTVDIVNNLPHLTFD